MIDSFQENDITDMVGNYKLINKTNMSKFFNWSSKDIVSAFVSSILMALLAMGIHVMEVGDIFSLKGKELANIGVMAMITGLVSLIKSLLTNSEGKFLGVTEIK